MKRFDHKLQHCYSCLLQIRRKIALVADHQLYFYCVLHGGLSLSKIGFDYDPQGNRFQLNH